ncbi:MAG TPA: hypothetical protein DCY94_02470 [Firmicutes bacterium]|nr:hypothetical protein [Bacillota bacterium]
MKKEVLEKVHRQVENAQEIVGTLVFSGGGGSDLVDLLNAAIELGHVSLMYGNDLSMEELNAVTSMFGFLENVVSPVNANEIEANMAILQKMVEKMSTLFREKKLLLGHEADEKIKCA